MAGDHKQLPPMLRAKNLAKNYKNIFEKLCEDYNQDPHSYTLLKTQYRMSENIMRVFSEFIYKNELKAGEAN